MVSKKLKAAALGGLFAIAYVQGIISRNRRRGVFIPKPLRQGITFDAVTAIYTEREFSRAFRMSRKVFQELLDVVRVHITKNAEMGRRSRRTTVLADVRLAITIRILAGGDVWDLVALYHVKACTIHRIFEDTINTLNRELKLRGIATTMRDLHKASMEFKTSRRRPSPFNGCVGALNGLAVKIKKPREEGNPAVYYNRSTHDSLAHAVSGLGPHLERGELNGEFWIAGDEAYVCTESLITPVPMSQASVEEGAFNFFLSSLRIHVEQAFGILVAKWAIMQKPLPFAVLKCSRIVCVAMKLHNFCSERGESRRQGMEREEFVRVYTESVNWHRRMRREIVQGLQESRVASAAEISTGSKKRDELIKIVRDKGLERPPVVGPRQGRREVV